MIRLTRLAVLVSAVAFTNACAYVEARWNDYCDVGTISGSAGAEIGVKFGEFLHLGMGGSVSTPMSPIFPPVPFLYQLMYGDVVQVTELWSPVSMFFASEYDAPMGLHTVSYRGIYPYPPVPGSELRELNPGLDKHIHAPPEHRCWVIGPFAFNADPVPTMTKDMFDLELSLCLVLGGKVLLRPVEFVDFLMGIIPGVDILGDDQYLDRVPHGPYWYKVRPLEPYEPLPPGRGPDHIAERVP